jgi:Cu(I)/Ag(I) efflux system membrane protein CusA/SilA
VIAAIIGWSVRNRLLVVAITLVLAIWGAFAATIAPIDAIPDVSENQVIIFANWPGHGPSEIEDQITSPLSLSINGVKGLKTIRSSSDVGASTLWVIFEDAVDIPTARRRLADRLTESDARSRFPEGVIPRLAPEAPATGQIFWYTVEGQGYDLAKLRAIQDWYVKPQLATVSGVAEVASVGGMSTELQIEADPIKLRQQNVAITDVLQAVTNATGSSSGGVIQRANAEFIVQSVNSIGQSTAGFDLQKAFADLRKIVVPTITGQSVLLEDVATVSIGPQSRRGAMERDGREVTGGVVLMAYGENPLALTNRLKAKVRELSHGLPKGVQILPMYDRTPLIRGAVGTVSGTIIEAMITASLCVLLVLQHARAAFVIVVTLPLSVLASFGVLELLRRLGIADIPLNTMSLAGLAISIGVIVDSAIVMTENVLHSLHDRFGSAQIEGDCSEIIIQACQQVGRPIVFSILIMLLSFIPVFTLGGIEGKMFRPLAATKTIAMAASGIMAITLVPALCATLVRGRVRRESENWIVRSVIEVYRPVLNSLLDRPAPLLWLLATTFALASAAIGITWIVEAAVALGILVTTLSARTWRGRSLSLGSFLLIAVATSTSMSPLGREFITPLDEGMVMDMPISIPRVSITQGVDDLKSRDMILCRFPEVTMVVGKLGRAETPTDPAPLDMIETMVELHPREFWPARSMSTRDQGREIEAIIEMLIRREIVERSSADTIASIKMGVVTFFDAQMREYAYQRMKDLFRSPGFEETSWRLNGLSGETIKIWHAFTRTLDQELRVRGAEILVRLTIEEAVAQGQSKRPNIQTHVEKVRRLRSETLAVSHHSTSSGAGGMSRTATLPLGLEIVPELVEIQDSLTSELADRIVLWKKTREDLVGFGAELDRAVPMPGWTNVWTMPIQNRVDMLSTGVNTTLGVRVIGRQLDDVVALSEKISGVLKTLKGAVNVVADPIRGKGTIEVRVDREKAGRLGVQIEQINKVVAIGLAGGSAGEIINGREHTNIRVAYQRANRTDIDAIKQLLVRAMPPGQVGNHRLIPLEDVAEIVVNDGPATIKGENGYSRNYVRLNLRDRSASDFVAEAKRAIADRIRLPEGSVIEWTGQFEHEEHAQRTLVIVIPIVLVLIFLILYATYRDLADACLMMVSVPGAIAGGIVCQWLMGTKFSVTVWVGYIACFGMATTTGVVMLVYLRDAIAKAGGLENMDISSLRLAVLDGAAHRLRPKLLTEATIILGLAPMLWADGVASEIIRPMAAPVLGGILVADEVIDLFLPLLFFQVRKWRLRQIAGRPSTDRPVMS